MLIFKNIFFTLIFFIFFKNINPAFRAITDLPFEKKDNFKGFFIRFFGNDNTIYVGNTYEEFSYDLKNKEKLEDYGSKSVCAQGSMCPLIMFSEGYNKGIPTYIISQSNGKPNIFNFLTKELLIFNGISFNDCRSIVQIGNENKFFICGSINSSDKNFVLIDIDNNSYLNKTKETVSAAVLYTEYNNEEHLWQINHDIHWVNDYIYINSVNIKSIGLEYKELSRFRDNNDDHGYLYNAILANAVIGCYQNKYCQKVYCYNLEYSGDSLSTKNETREFISNCGTSTCDDKTSFSVIKVADNRALISCGHGSLNMVIINDNFEVVNRLYTDEPILYEFMDVTMLNEFKMLIGMYNQSGYYYSTFSFPKCVAQINVFVARKQKFYIKEIFENIDITKTDITRETFAIKFTSDTKGKIFENEEHVLSNVIKETENIYYYHTLNEEITFNYKGIEYNTLKDSTYSYAVIDTDECKLTIKTCYISCDQCDENDIGDDSNHKCINCNNDYGYYWDQMMNSKFCIQKPSNYYLDSTSYSEKVVKPCYELCKSCSIGGNDEIHNCDTCIDGYYKIQGNIQNNNCYNIKLNN